MLLKKGGKVIAANIWGKLKTVTQMIGIILTFLCKYPYFTIGNSITEIESIISILATFTITISVIATIFSGINYLKGSKELLKD